MKPVSCILFALCLGVVSAQQRQQQKAGDKLDNIDLDSILKSERLLQGYVNCLLDRAKCTPDGAEMKRIFPDALQTGCSKCSETQKSGSRKFVNYLIDNKPDVWILLEKKYDPQGSYKKKYKDQTKKQGVHI